ncbi:MAG: ankyrin repeat domain-containing protein [Pseudomonadota bacterium]
MFTKYLKNLVYTIAVVTVLSANAGSYEDFFIAIKNDNASNLQGLLERGFDPNTRDPKGQTGLNIALLERSTKTAKLLLAQPGIDVNLLNSAGESALMVAALKGDVSAVQTLLERGAKVNQPGWSALHYASTGPDAGLVKLLLDRGAELDAASPNGTTPLMMAAQYGSEDSVSLLLARGADVNRRNERDLRAVDFARMSGREGLIRKLESLTTPR